MKPKELKIDVPECFLISKNVLTDYNPQTNYSEDDSLIYLQEDLFQTTNESTGITIDLGWYGNVITNEGSFKIYIVKDFDWEKPVKIIESKSVQEIHIRLVKELSMR